MGSQHMNGYSKFVLTKYGDPKPWNRRSPDLCDREAECNKKEFPSLSRLSVRLESVH